MSYKEAINNGIKRLRLKHKLTQEQFAEKINLSIQGYRNIEHNKYQPTSDTIDKICNVFNIEPIELLLPDTPQEISKIIEIINYKLSNCDMEKLIKISNMIDLM